MNSEPRLPDHPLGDSPAGAADGVGGDGVFFSKWEWLPGESWQHSAWRDKNTKLVSKLS